MGLFGKRLPECDWCGRAIEGDGLVDGDLLLCSQACLDHKNTPHSVTAQTVPDLRSPTRGLATAELAFARRELDSCAQLADRERARAAYLGCWRKLGAVRRLLRERGRDLVEFDALHRRFLDGAEVVDVSRGRTKAAVPPVSADERRLAEEALVLLERTLAKLADP